MAFSLVTADARSVPLPASSVDVVVTSPPYWKKRDYGVRGQMGQEESPDAYAAAIAECLEEWRRVLTPTGSVVLNVGDGYFRRSLAGIPGRVEEVASRAGWKLRNRIIWSKARGMPDPARDRLASRHEYILHLTPGRSYYYDLHGYVEQYGRSGDVWEINPERGMHAHLAPYPQDLARRALLLTCPKQVCVVCGHVSMRILERGTALDDARPQARRAMELAAVAGLTPAHIAAIQATGISDAGKARHFQTGTGRNSSAVQSLAAEAKHVLGGYFREFTMAPYITAGWTNCGHSEMRPGRVLDPFSGTGTTGVAAAVLGRDYVGLDLDSANHAIARERFVKLAPTEEGEPCD